MFERVKLNWLLVTHHHRHGDLVLRLHRVSMLFNYVQKWRSECLLGLAKREMKNGRAQSPRNIEKVCNCARCVCVFVTNVQRQFQRVFLSLFFFSIWFFLSIRSKNACMRANVGVCVVHSFDCLQFDSQTRTDNRNLKQTESEII